MKLWRCLGSEPQSAEDGIGSGTLRFANDPSLHTGQTLGRLVNVVAVEIGDGVEQLIDAPVSAIGWSRHGHRGIASRDKGDGTRSIALSHPIALPHCAPAAIAGTPSSIRTRYQSAAG